MTLLNGEFSKSHCGLWNSGHDLSYYFPYILRKSNSVRCKCYPKKDGMPDLPHLHYYRYLVQ